LLDRSINIVTEEQDRKQKEHHIQTALTHCGYPDWRWKVRWRLLSTRKSLDGNKTTVVLPYVQDLSEAVTRVYNRYGISTSMRPFKSLRNLLVHPKDKPRQEDVCECVYKIPCRNCNKTYIGETGRAFGVRLQEHRQEVLNAPNVDDSFSKNI